METAGTQGKPVGDVPELLQEEERPELPGAWPNVPVSVDGPVQTHAVPSVSAGSRTFIVSTTAKRVANADPRRRVVRIIGTGGTFRVGSTQNEVGSDMTSATWPPSIVLELTHSDAIYVQAASTDVTLTVIVENWAS